MKSFLCENQSYEHFVHIYSLEQMFRYLCDFRFSLQIHTVITFENWKEYWLSTQTFVLSTSFGKKLKNLVHHAKTSLAFIKTNMYSTWPIRRVFLHIVNL